MYDYNGKDRQRDRSEKRRRFPPKKPETLVRRENTEGKSGIPVSSKEKEARAYGPGKHV
jgi:hypothetical protein